MHFALADGVSCFRNGIEYAHGGISLQECLMLQLVISENENRRIDEDILIADVVWKGMRCSIEAEGDFRNARADIRIKAALPETSIVMRIKEFNEYGIVSLVVEDDSYENNTAYIVLLDKNDKVIYKTTTVVGGGN